MGTQREELAEGMRAPSVLPDPDDSDDSDNNDCYMSDFYSDDEQDRVGHGNSYGVSLGCNGGAYGRNSSRLERHGARGVRGGAGAASRAGAGKHEGEGAEGGRVVPEWSELETAVQALMGMDGGMDLAQDRWDEMESVR